MNTQMKLQRIEQENLEFAGTAGVSEGNSHMGFVPAFMDKLSGDVVLCRFKNGMLAPFHTLESLPDRWVVARDLSGHVTEIRSSVISGFVRLGQFFTREEAAAFVRI